MINYAQDCAPASSWVSEGDGTQMLTFCAVHPEYRWYSDSWPTSEEINIKMAEHQEQIKLTFYCPECRAGKHENCNGASWDPVKDSPIDCPCRHKG